MRLNSVFLAGFLLLAQVVHQPLTDSYIKIDKSENKLVYYAYHVPVRTFSVATGRTAVDTPTGVFSVVMLVKDPWYLKKNIPGG
ncbi:MAG: L,D-transpeptidase, partial [Tumebacillaceae bacterium]